APTPSPSRRTSAHYARSSPTRRARKPSSADRLSSSAGLRWSLTVYAWSSSQLSSSAARTAQSLRSPQSFQPSEWPLSHIQSFSSNRSFHRSSHKETCRLVGPLTTLLLSMFTKDRANTCARRAADKCTLSSAEDRAQNSATRASDQRSLARPDTVVVPVARITVVVAIAVIAAIVFGVAAIVIVATIVSASATLVRAAV